MKKNIYKDAWTYNYDILKILHTKRSVRTMQHDQDSSQVN